MRLGLAGTPPLLLSLRYSFASALGSAACGPEAALTVLLPLGASGLIYVVPLSGAVIALLAIVYLSYRQTIAAYPTGGGSYTVAKHNLRARVGLLAGTALIIDYLLNVAVGISTGRNALVSALQPHTLGICLGILGLLTIINLRGVREAGVIFMLPTYMFVGCLAGIIEWGLFKVFISGGHPTPVAALPRAHASVQVASLWLIMSAFASGCTAMTGVEASATACRRFASRSSRPRNER